MRGRGNISNHKHAIGGHGWRANARHMLEIRLRLERDAVNSPPREMFESIKELFRSKK